MNFAFKGLFFLNSAKYSNTWLKLHFSFVCISENVSISTSHQNSFNTAFLRLFTSLSFIRDVENKFHWNVENICLFKKRAIRIGGIFAYHSRKLIKKTKFSSSRLLSACLSFHDTKWIAISLEISVIPITLILSRLIRLTEEGFCTDTCTFSAFS